MKFQSFIKYFDWVESQATLQEQQQQQQQQQCGAESQEKKDVTDANGDDANACMKVSRKVFSGKQWLTIEDWLECAIPLCALEVKHEGRIERCHENVVQTIFASSRLGGDFLSNGWSQVCRTNLISFYSYFAMREWLDLNRLLFVYMFFFFYWKQECLEFSLFPELIAILLYVEALEDNEVVFVENVRQFNRILIDSNKRPYLEDLDQPKKVRTKENCYSMLKLLVGLLPVFLLSLPLFLCACLPRVGFCMFNGC